MDSLLPLAKKVGEKLKARKETVGVSESSAGGLISAVLLAVPGASAYFMGGAVVYTRPAGEAFLTATKEKRAGIRSSSEPWATLAAELVRLGSEVIVAGANAAVVAAKNATRTIPIVMFLTVDPVGSSLVASLARPGGNVTGLTTTAGSEIYGKQLQLLKDTFPQVGRIAIFINRAGPAHAVARVLQETEKATRALGLQRQLVEVRGPNDFDQAFAALAVTRPDAIFVTQDSMFYQHRARLVQLVAKTRLPAMWGLRDQAEAGGLMAYATDLNDLARRAAGYVDKILKGAKPADLPVEQPTKFEFVINLKTAKALGLTIPPSLLRRADEIIQ
jgi:putative ABC transport system substrate-binding protein